MTISDVSLLLIDFTLSAQFRYQSLYGLDMPFTWCIPGIWHVETVTWTGRDPPLSVLYLQIASHSVVEDGLGGGTCSRSLHCRSWLSIWNPKWDKHVLSNESPVMGSLFHGPARESTGLNLYYTRYSFRWTIKPFTSSHWVAIIALICIKIFDSNQCLKVVLGVLHWPKPDSH